MNNEQKSALREAAKSATPGPLRADLEDWGRFIALANPAAVIELLDEVERLSDANFELQSEDSVRQLCFDKAVITAIDDVCDRWAESSSAQEPISRFSEELAQAAIDTVFAELMEPSDAALIAGNSVMDEYANEQIDRRREVRDVFKAMLSAARGRE